jgi:hypothetical protein
VLSTITLFVKVNVLEGTKEILTIKRRIAIQFASLIFFLILFLSPDTVANFVFIIHAANVSNVSNSTIGIVSTIMAIDHSLVGIMTLCMLVEFLLLIIFIYYIHKTKVTKSGKSRDSTK